MTDLRRLARGPLRRLFPRGASQVMPFMMQWGKVRAEALIGRFNPVRGTVIVWPRAGRVWTMGRDFRRPRKGEVLVRIDASVVSPGTERAFFLSLPNAVSTFPSYPGYSEAGTVVEAGKGVGTFRPGDRVALAAPHGSLAVARASVVYPIPPGVSTEEAAFVQLGIIALHAYRHGQVRPGEPVLVLGQGLIGQLIVQLASALGAHPVISIARSDRRVTEALPRFAQHVVILSRDGLAALDGWDSPVTFEATGSPDGLPLALRCTGRYGRVVLAGSTRGATPKADFGLVADRHIRIVGAHITSLADEVRPVYGQLFFRLIEQQRLDVRSLISQRVHPLEAERFYRGLASRGDATVGAVFCWDRLPERERMRRVSLWTPPDLAPLRRAAMSRRGLAARVGAVRAAAAGRS